MSEAPTLPRRQLAQLAALGAFLGAGTALAQAGKAGSRPATGPLSDLKAVVDEHNKAFNAHDVKGVLRAFAPNALLIGTAPGEIWGGHEEIGEAYERFIADFDPGKQAFENLWWDGGIRGEMAWLLTSSKVTMTKGKEKREFGINASVTFEKLDGKWLIRAMHFSNLTHVVPVAPEKKP